MCCIRITQFQAVWSSDRITQQSPRGLEQRQFEKLGGLEGTSNKQNPVGPNNPRREEYLAKADEHINKPPKACE